MASRVDGAGGRRCLHFLKDGGRLAIIVPEEIKEKTAKKNYTFSVDAKTVYSTNIFVPRFYWNENDLDLEQEANKREHVDE